MTERRRDWCPECARSCALTTAGRIWAHARGPGPCLGTGRLPSASWTAPPSRRPRRRVITEALAVADAKRRDRTTVKENTHG